MCSRSPTFSDPFIAPAKLLEAAAKGPLGRYVHEPLAEVPVNFLSECCGSWTAWTAPTICWLKMGLPAEL